MHWLSWFSAFDLTGALMCPPLAYFNWRAFRNVASHDEARIIDVYAAGLPALGLTIWAIFGWARLLGARI